MMTKVAQLFEDEKIEYGKKVAKEAKNMEIKFVKKLFAYGDSVDDIAAIATILTREEIIALEKEVKQK